MSPIFSVRILFPASAEGTDISINSIPGICSPKGHDLRACYPQQGGVALVGIPRVTWVARWVCTCKRRWRAWHTYVTLKSGETAWYAWEEYAKPQKVTILSIRIVRFADEYFV